MRAKLGLLVLGVALLLAARPVIAHHSFAAEYDAKQPLTLTGTVSKVEWMNPHARFYVDAVDEKGTVTTWNIELASPNSLVRNGWTRKSLNIGDKVTVKGYAARSGAKMANASSVTLADGRSVFAGSPGGDAPSQ
jgi:Family of unknown function (DUF6152)